jgi:hypothetical protein
MLAASKGRVCMVNRWVEEYRSEARRLRRLAEASRSADSERDYLAQAENYERMAADAHQHEERFRLSPDAPTQVERGPRTALRIALLGLGSLKPARR